MTTYISILRGINVSGQKLIKMDALKQMCENLNFIYVQTYIQSGNIVFQSEDSELSNLEELISKQILLQFRFDVPVIVLSIEKLQQIIASNPYTSDQTKDISGIYVTFLSSPAKEIHIDIIKQKLLQEEEVTLTENAVYLYCPNGYGKTKLTNTFLESKLKVNATTRNWKTTNELLRMAESHG